jgi:hypothetical protein
MVLQQELVVGDDGKVTIDVPAAPGAKVHVRVAWAENGAVLLKSGRILGDLRGKIRMSDDFDDPLPEFEPYS